MMWERKTFKEFVQLQRGFDLTRSSMADGEFPVLGSNCIIGYHKEFKVEGPGVITGRSGTLGEVQYVDGKYWPHNTSLWVKDFKKNHPRFVYYMLQTLDLKSYNGGGAVPTLNRNNLDNIEVNVPPYPIQQKIAAILSAYDDLIENNMKRITLLEKSARLLYEEWFVRLRFPGYEHTTIVNGVPEGWEKKKLGNAITLNYGKALKESNRVAGDFPVYGSSGVVGTNEKALVEGPAIIVGRKGNVGSVYWSDKNCWPIDTVYYINSEETNLHLYFSLQYLPFINSDAAVPGLNRNHAYNLDVIIPPGAVLESFDELVKPMHNQVLKLQQQNDKLKQARDILLPKLINGEIPV
jgi:type I restriction enzyme, S subunit